jgi:hypothetical protein
LAFIWTPYYVLLAGVLYAIILAVGAARIGLSRRWGALASYGWCAVGPGCFLLVVAAISLLGGHSPAAANPIVELYQYSARSFEYVVPDAWNPLLGDLTASYLEAHRHGSYKVEQSLYLGLSLLGLALVSVALALREVRQRRRSSPRVTSPAVVAAFAAVAVVASIFSAPPTTDVLGFELRTPSWYIHEITTVWRVFARFGLVVMLGVCVLAAIGLASLLNGRNEKVRAALLAFAGVVIVVDLISIPPERTNRLDAPAIYARLQSLPPGLAAEYPMARAPYYGDYNELLYQDAHDKPLINGYDDDSPAAERVLALARLDPKTAAPTFALLGVRYIVVRKESPLLGPGLFPPDMSSRGFRLLGEDSYAQVFEIDAEPRGSLITFTKGFDQDEGGFRWMTSAEGGLEVRAACSPCEGSLVFDAWSFARKRTMVVASGSEVLMRATVTEKHKTFRVPVRFRDRLMLRVSVTPGPQSVRSVVPASHDLRSISVGLSYPPRFEPNSPLR